MSPLDANSEGDASAFPGDAVEVGRIIDAFGIKGWIRVQPYSADPQALVSSKRWFLKAPPQARVKRPGADAPAIPPFLDIKLSQEHGDDVVAQVVGVSDRNAAEALRGALVYCSRANFPATSIDEYYWVDLIGLQVVDREGRPLGTVTGLLDTGPHSVLRLSSPAESVEVQAPASQAQPSNAEASAADAVTPSAEAVTPSMKRAAAGKRRLKPQAEERMIPFVAAHIDSVDLPSRTIVANWDFDF